MTWHLYVYCVNNSVKYTDPSGHSPLSDKLSILDYHAIHTYVQKDYMYKLMGLGHRVTMEKASNG